MQNQILRIHPQDNVAVALVNLKAGDMISFEGDKLKYFQI